MLVEKGYKMSIRVVYASRKLLNKLLRTVVIGRKF